MQIEVLTEQGLRFFAMLAAMGGFSLLSIPDIATPKAYAIGRRGSYKDYVDLHLRLHLI